MSTNSNNKRIAKNTAFLYIRMAVIMLASFYLVRVVVNVLGVEDYGLYNVIGGFVYILSILNLTLSSGIHRYYNEEIGKRNWAGITKVFNVSIRIQLFIVIAIFLFIETIGIWYIETKMVIAPERLSAARWIFQFSALSLVLVVMQAPFTSAILSYERMDYYAYVSLIEMALKLGVAFLIQTICYDKLILYGFLMLSVTLISFLLSSGYCKFKFKEIKLEKSIDKTLMKKMLNFSGWLVLEPFAWSMRGSGSNILLNAFFGTIINAAYGISYQVASSIDQFCSGISMAFKPQLIQSYASGNYDRTKQLLYSMSKVLFILKLTICIPIVFEIKSILDLWMGEGYPSYAISFTALAVIVRLIDSLNQPITTVIYATEKIKRYMIFTSSTLFCVLPVSYILFKLGCTPNSLFAAMITLTGLNQIISIELISKQCEFFNKKEYIMSVLLPCLVQSIVVSILVSSLSSLFANPIIRLLVASVVSVLGSCFSAYLFMLNKEERSLARNYVINITNKVKKH